MISLEINGSDFSKYSGGISLSNNTDSLGTSLSFNVARNYNDSSFSKVETIEVGNSVRLTTEGNLMFIGIVIDVETTKFQKSIKCLDFHFYLNKNKLIVQFNNIDASGAIQNVLGEVSVSTGSFESIATAITKIYKNNTVAEIIEDILKQVLEETGEKYLLEIDESNKFNLIKYKKINVKADYNFIGAITKSESMNEMKNVILVTSNDQEEMSILHMAEDGSSIKKYGQLQEIIQVDPNKDISNVRNIAETKLKELNKVFTNASVEVFGNSSLKSGRLLNVTNEEFGLSGSFLIKSCTHKWEKGRHITSMDLEVV